ncbi:ABC transporter substrate-binding protein [Paenibacillus aquistagni]|uniref:Carbohydrate ABC transporter substrate-binding protein, CUT1 family n=1 Tax=Paenibacillus aquistagni TaxID=1852522 RepID=A0A1X7JJS4_9BACL|nr:extracellular solute-binding protein [Paenibacillus aquistagni]NMM54456.1 extracellular solute-binding protein [Paenibacillus aquistagni]SMG28415.1 carbohydrate ABC transporter substrate-binding protein, CUT1 family [Paenibacillus aquistagni]
MKKSLVMMLTLLFVATSLLAACGNSSSGNSGDTAAGNNSKPAEEKKVEPFELTLRHTQLGEAKKNRFAILEDAVKATEAEVDGLTIKLDGVDSEVNRKEKLRGEMAQGNPPDIFDAFGSPDVGVYAKEGLVLDITSILEELGIKERFGTSLDPWTVDGKVYGTPIGGSIEGYFYNKEYFEQKGLKVPTTIAELEQLAEKIKADGKIPFAQASKDAWVPLMTTNNLWAYTAGSDFTYGFKKGETKWNDPKMVEALAKHQEWIQKGYYKKGELGLAYGDQRNQIINGEAIMMFDGSWANSVFLDPAQSGDMVGKIGFFLMPPFNAGDGYSIMQDSNNGYSFSAKVADDPQKLAAVKSFIKNLYSEEMQIRGLKEDGLLPAMQIPTEKMNEAVTNDLMKEIIGTLADVKYKWPAFDALVQADVNTELSKEIQKMIGGEATPQEVLDKVQAVQEKANASE